MRVLVTGGAGYIGSFMVHRLLQDGVDVTVLDSLERGRTDRIPDSVEFIQGTLLDKDIFPKIFSQSFDGVIHFAAYISVKESTEHPEMYFENNVQATKNLLDAMAEANVKNIVFSSSAAVYGNPQEVPIPEDHPKHPESPYGESKLKVEEILKQYHESKQINSVSLRYFNASGAALDGSNGEAHNPETHIIPCAIQAILDDKEFTLFGNDYDTRDGTCVRDYIHVLDLAEAHVLSLKKLKEGTGCFAYNVGTGKGFSNQEIVNTVQKVSGREMKVKMEARRPGDPAILVADPTKIKNELGFSPRYSDIETVISSAWKWHSKGK